MKKILILGAGVEQIPAIKIARGMGHEVIVTDMNMKAPGIPHANKAFEISTTDIPGTIEVAKKEKIDGVMTVSSETAVLTVAAVAKELDLPSFSERTALNATNKAQMRKKLSSVGVRVSPYSIVDDIEQAREFANDSEGPWVLKPVDSSGQRGTYMVESDVDLQPAFTSAKSFSRVGKVLIDRFVKGPEIHVAMQVINGRVHFLALSDRVTLNRNYFGIAIRHVGPSVVDPQTEKEICKMCKKSVSAIGLVNGVATCELILDKGKPVLMEVAVRTPGGYLREVAMYLSGVDMIRAIIWNCLGEDMNIEQMKTEEIHPAISVKFISSLNLDKRIKTVQDIRNIDKVKEIDGIKEVNIHHSLPFQVPELTNSVGRFGAIIAVGNNREEAKGRTEEAFNMLEFNGYSLKEYTDYSRYNLEFK